MPAALCFRLFLAVLTVSGCAVTAEANEEDLGSDDVTEVEVLSPDAFLDEACFLAFPPHKIWQIN